MNEKLNPKAVEQYTNTYTDAVIQAVFDEKKVIHNDDILQLTPSKQVNLFVIRELMHAWKQEIEKSKSAYFDYAHPDVQQAMAQYQGVLSHHIQLTAQLLLPILKKAVTRALVLILDPYGFYGKLIEQDPLTLSWLQEELKYVKINKEPLHQFVTHLQQRNLEQVSADTADELLVLLLKDSQYVPDSVENQLAVFSQLSPVEISFFYEKARVPEVAAPVIPKASFLQQAKKETQSRVQELAQRRSLSIRESLSINQKFMFTKMLFHGDFEIFNVALDRIERMESYDRVLHYLHTEFPNWDTESDEYEEFVFVIEKHFRKQEA